jgi:peptidoglycan/LPS O-acetylase OafA/YrhL
MFAIASGFGLEDPWSYRFFPFELALFIAGVFSHQLFLQPSISLAAKSSIKNLPAYVLTLCVAATTLYGVVPLPEAVKTAAVLALLFVSLPFLFIFRSQSKWDKLIGDLSYPIYIGHLLVLLTLAYLVRMYGFVSPTSWTRSLLGVAGALIFAGFLKFFVTDPIEALRRRVKRGNIKRPADRAPG